MTPAAFERPTEDLATDVSVDAEHLDGRRHLGPFDRARRHR